MTPDVQENLLKSVKLGMTLALAAQRAGITPQTAHNWRKRGEEEGDGPFFDFSVELARARSQGVATLLGKVWEAIANGDVASARWLLAHLEPEAFGDKGAQMTQVMNAQVNAQVASNAESMSDQQIEARLAELRQLQEGDDDDEG